MNSSSASTTSIPAISGAAAQPIQWWAGLGLCFFILELYIFGSWILSDKFVTTDPGSTVAPTYQIVLIRGFEALGLFAFAWVLVWLVRTWRRDGTIPTFAVFIGGWITAFWQDPIANYLVPTFSYSSHFVNFGSWSEFIPGWLSPNGSKMPEPVLFQFGVYGFVIPASALVTAAAMRWTKRRWPGMGMMGLIIAAWIAMFFYDLIIEAIWVRTFMYAYPGTIHAWSLWGGELHQFPYYESLYWGAALAAVGSLFYFRNDKGQTLVERGSEKLVNDRLMPLRRIFAVGAFINLAYLGYNVFWSFTAIHVDAWPAGYQSYIRNQMCGIGTNYECPGPDVNIARRGAVPMPPYSGRN